MIFLFFFFFPKILTEFRHKKSWFFKWHKNWPRDRNVIINYVKHQEMYPVCIADLFCIVSDHIWIPGPNFMPFKKSWFSGLFFMPKFSKDFGAKNIRKSWILKTHNFWSKRRNIIGNGAKHIYFIQRIHWKKFQLWVLTRNSSGKNFSFYVKSVKMQKNQENQEI